MITWGDIGLNAGNSEVGIGLAFLAGVVAFFSPCILPVIPVYFSYFSGLRINQLRNAKIKLSRWYILRNAALFVSGFLLVFMALGLAFGAMGSFFATKKILFQRIGGILLVLFGLHLLEVFRIPALYKRRAFQSAHQRLGRFRGAQSFVAGVTFGFAWTPCIGPVLATILFYATWVGGSLRGMILLLAFALGMGVPFIIAALALQWFLGLFASAAKSLMLIQKIAGAIIFITGLAFLTGMFNWVISFFVGQWSLPI